MSGWTVGRVTIAPSRRDRIDGLDGYVDTAPPDPSVRWHIGLSATAAADVYAAGQAWDTLMAAEERDLRTAAEDLLDAWRAGDGDREAVADHGVTRTGHLAGIARMLVVLRRPRMRAAVLETRARLLSSRSGEIWGTTVEQICQTHDLVPACHPDRSSTRAARSVEDQALTPAPVPSRGPTVGRAAGLAVTSSRRGLR